MFNNFFKDTHTDVVAFSLLLRASPLMVVSVCFTVLKKHFSPFCLITSLQVFRIIQYFLINSPHPDKQRPGFLTLLTHIPRCLSKFERVEDVSLRTSTLGPSPSAQTAKIQTAKMFVYEPELESEP